MGAAGIRQDRLPHKAHKAQRLQGTSKVNVRIWTFRGAEEELESEEGEK